MKKYTAWVRDRVVGNRRPVYEGNSLPKAIELLGVAVDVLCLYRLTGTVVVYDHHDKECWGRDVIDGDAYEAGTYDARLAEALDVALGIKKGVSNG